MKIKKIEINNFYSIKKASVDFTKFDGLVQIEGHNKDTGDSNGAGKSAIIEAVVWGLFGKTIRKSNEAAILNNQNPKNCCVRIEVDDIVIERCKKPTNLFVYVNGEDKTQKNVLTTQKFIEDYLQTNYKIFLASTVFGQENNVQFVGASPEDKRLIIKNFLDQGQLFEYRESVKFLKSEYNQEIKKQDAIIQEYDKSISEIDDKLENLEKLKKELTEEFEEEVLQTPFDEIVKEEREYYTLKDKKENIEYSIRSLTKKLNSVENSIKNPKNSCTECGKPLDNVQEHLDKLALTKDEILDKIKQEKDKLSKIKKLIKTPKVTSADYKKLMHFQNLKREEDTLELIRESNVDKMDAAYQKQKEASKHYDIMRFWEKAFSESGLVRFLIRNIIKYFNDKTNFYLSHLSRGKFTIEFNEDLTETITHYGREVNYMSMSGGEKKKIDLSVTLGLQSLLTMTSKTEVNLLFLDEVAEYLDQDGLYGLYILLQELKKNKTLFVITHNNYLKSLIDNNKVLSIMKVDGITTVKDH